MTLRQLRREDVQTMDRKQVPFARTDDIANGRISTRSASLRPMQVVAGGFTSLQKTRVTSLHGVESLGAKAHAESKTARFYAQLHERCRESVSRLCR